MEPNHSEKLYPCRIFRHKKNTCERAQLTFCLISSRKCSHLSVWRTRLVIPQVILPPSVRTRCYSAVEPTKQEQAAHSNNNCVKMRIVMTRGWWKHSSTTGQTWFSIPTSTPYCGLSVSLLYSTPIALSQRATLFPSQRLISFHLM